jgi:hypothetical protein
VGLTSTHCKEYQHANDHTQRHPETDPRDHGL